VSRTGRRPGAPDTREDILAAARRAFAARGYEATSLRSIAKQVHVDPALLVHYFGSKDGLFLDALEVPEAAELIVGRYLLMLDQEPTRDVVLGLVRSAVSSERAATMLREFLTKEMLTSLSSLIDRPDGQLRASLVVAQLIGIAMLRHVVRSDAVVRASNDDLVSLVAPVIEGYLR
jgi:AcrR family transcriptional regulator